MSRDRSLSWWGGEYAEDEARRERVGTRLHRTGGQFVAGVYITIVLKMVSVEQDGCGTGGAWAKAGGMMKAWRGWKPKSKYVLR